MRTRSSRRFCHVPRFRSAVAFCLMLGILTASPVAAGPPLEAVNPTALLSGIRDLFSAIERAAEAGRWGEAGETLGKICRFFYSIAPDPVDYETKALYQNFGAALADFKIGLEARKAGEMERFGIPLQMVFFDVMKRYDCPEPPALFFMEKDMERAFEALARDDLEEVAHEVDEVAAFYPGAGRPRRKGRLRGGARRLPAAY